jgi:hypothetical protein
MIKLEVGKSYKTRGGWKATVYKQCGNYHVFHYGNGHDETTPICHYEDGRSNLGYQRYDIIAEWEEPMDLTKITTPFGLLDKETQERLKAHGGPYEMVQIDGWQFWDYPTWTPYMTYRVKPKPFVEYKKTDYIQGFSDRVYTITEKFVDGKYDSYTVDMVPF